MESVAESAPGVAKADFRQDGSAPAAYYAMAWDFYRGEWTLWNGGLPFMAIDPAASSAALPFGEPGAYHLWISALYGNGAWLPCPNPWTGVLFGGTPKTPEDFWVEPLGQNRVRAHWRPEVYATWHYQLLVYKGDEGWIDVEGPSGFRLWHFVDYPNQAYDPAKASFGNGWADFQLPSAGEYWIAARAIGWIPPYQGGPFASAGVVSGP
ncbi:MAG: hypothetical protein BWZ10_01771 [candidate division BRC1 bacterium ADurb.BinA364]|nr:MAG: hypothetical protein BWZ10_01771 [candidate division BRC1 bacterium ADurb.BinA364]